VDDDDFYRSKNRPKNASKSSSNPLFFQYKINTKPIKQETQAGFNHGPVFFFSYLFISSFSNPCQYWL
jgi:hypothetical protein